MNITITGASGLIGRRLMKNLAGAGHALHVLSRHAGTNMPPGVKLSVWDPVKGLPPEESLRDAGAVIHLAGESVAQRWSEDAKRRIADSRVVGTRNLVAGIAKLARKPEVLVSARRSAITGRAATRYWTNRRRRRADSWARFAPPGRRKRRRRRPSACAWCACGREWCWMRAAER